MRCASVEVALRVDAVEPGADHRDRAAPAPSSAPSCAAPSMPSARPETTVSPAPARCAREGARVLERPAASGCGCRRWPCDAALQQLDAALRVQQQRRVGGLQQRRRVARVAERDDVARARRRRCSQASVAATSASSVVGSARAAPARGARPTTSRRAPRRRANTACGEPKAREQPRAPTRGRRRASRAGAARRASSSRSLTRQARPDARTWRRRAGQGCVKRSPARDRVLDRQDQRVGHAVEDAEHEQQAVALVGQLDRSGAAGVGRVDDALAVAPQRQHVAALHAVARALVDRDDLVLAGGQRVAVDRDDLAVDRRCRRVRHVVRELARRHRRQAVADAGFLARCW